MEVLGSAGSVPVVFGSADRFAPIGFPLRMPSLLPTSPRPPAPQDVLLAHSPACFIGFWDQV
eukprot:8670346-Alexandrium_andersonii.AAC.1